MSSREKSTREKPTSRKKSTTRDSDVIIDVTKFIVGGANRASQHYLSRQRSLTYESQNTRYNGGYAKQPDRIPGREMRQLIKGGGVVAGDVADVVPDVITNCSLVAPNSRETCLPENVVEKVKKLAKKKSGKDIQSLSQAKRVLGCTTDGIEGEHCLLDNEEFKIVLGKNEAERLKFANYKIRGPTDVGLLSNVNIDTVMQQWAVAYPTFYPYSFNMIDYEQKKDTLYTTNIADVYAKGKRTAACVINSDYSYGRGKHWMALFVDMRGLPFTIEFFNSSGGAPEEPWRRWMRKTEGELSTIVDNSQIQIINNSKHHQNSKTECGVYSLYYIWARLQGRPIDTFTKTIPDEVMFEFRQHLFANEGSNSWINSERKFDLEKFGKGVNILWEK